MTLLILYFYTISPQSFFASRFFEILDQDKEGSIDLEEFLQGMQMLMTGSPERKLRFLFDVYDMDGEFDSVSKWKLY